MKADVTKNMRLGLILPGFSADHDDWCIPALRNLVRELARSHEIEIFALRYPNRRESYQIGGVTVHALGGGLSRGLGRVGLFARASARISRVHRARRLDLLHAFWADEPGYLAVTSGRRFGVPAVVSLMGGELARLPEIGYGGQLALTSRALTRHALEKANRVTVGSEYLRRMCGLIKGKDRPLTLPLGVDTALFKPASTGAPSPLKKGDIKLLKVASLVPVKGHAMLLHALALASAGTAADLHLHLVGEGPLLGELEQLAGSLGVAGQVTFHGAVRHERMAAYYRAADLCVQSSLHESQSLAVLESAACGTATVGTAVGILPELGPAARTTANDARALADALLAVLHAPGQTAAMGQLAHNIVLERYAIQRTARELTGLYSEIADRPPQPHARQVV